MNTQALKKCLIELEKDTPNIAYVRGILETVIELNEPTIVSSAWQGGNNPSMKLAGDNNVIELTDEQKEQEEFARQYSGGTVAQLQ